MCIWDMAGWGSSGWCGLAFGIALFGFALAQIRQSPAGICIALGIGICLAIFIKYVQMTDCECCVQQSLCKTQNCCTPCSPRQCYEPAPCCQPSEKARTPDQPTLYRF